MERTTETHYDSIVAARKRRDAGTFPDDLKAVRDQLGLTQHEAGVLLDIQPRTVGRYEAGESVPHPLTQEAILNALRAELKKQSRRKPSAG